MTRETKIGLLVGLAFIIVVGILLSDHMTSTIEPSSAPLQVAGNNLRSGLGQPASDEDAASNAPLAQDTAHVTPREPVPTQEELSPRPKPVIAPPPISIEPPVTLMGKDPSTGAAGKPPITLGQAARAGGEELVDNNGQPLSSETAPAATVAPVPLKRAVRTYKAQPGDSLSKMAARMLGANTKANRDLIVAVNRSLQADPDKIVVGHTYSIPLPAKTAALPVATDTAAAKDTASDDRTEIASRPSAHASDASDDNADVETPAPAHAHHKTADPQYIYTVKPGDTLWKIAVNELGDADTISAIEALNRNVLKGNARIHPNMKLRLPAKPVADAN